MMHYKKKISFVNGSIFQEIMITILHHKLGLFELLFISRSGAELLNNLTNNLILPEICLIDLDNIGLDEVESIKDVAERFPTIKLLGYTSDCNMNTAYFIKMGLLHVFVRNKLIDILNESYLFEYDFKQMEKHLRKLDLTDF
ncbi:hypothetical protein [Sphingobacterium sp. WOUb80]|uniref:hypothetical protein n=1 Tax=Sphingobacterium sp. WOUb80 TaxID=3234028 RepID=UPI003CF7787F